MTTEYRDMCVKLKEDLFLFSTHSLSDDMFVFFFSSSRYTLQIIMVREPESILFNMMFALLVVDFMVWTAHGVPIGDLADRLSVNLTLLLTAMAFKFVLSDTLPPTPYLTTMERYVLWTFVVLFLQGASFW